MIDEYAFFVGISKVCSVLWRIEKYANRLGWDMVLTGVVTEGIAEPGEMYLHAS